MFNIFKKKIRSLPAIRRKAIEYAMFYFRDSRPRHGLLLPNQHVTIWVYAHCDGPEQGQQQHANERGVSSTVRFEDTIYGGQLLGQGFKQ